MARDSLNQTDWVVTPLMRFFRDQLLAIVLVCTTTISAYSQKNENNPNKIGHRVVAHKSMISPENERQVGKGMAENYEKYVQIIHDPVVDAYVTTVADSVIRNSDWKGQISLRVVKSPEIESRYLPGGFVYLNSGLLLASDNDDQIAAVIAHEVAHTAARHWASQTTKMVILQSALLPSIFTPQGASATRVARGCFAYSPRNPDDVPFSIIKYVREDELEADYLGLQYTYKAGYNPNAYVVFLRKLSPGDAAAQGTPDVLRWVPPLSQRIANAEEEIHKILPNASAQTKLSPEFVQMKSRL